MNEKTTPAEIRYALAALEDLHLREPHTSDNGSDDLYLDGYAAVFNQRTTLYDGSFVRLHEMIAPEAFDDVLAAEPDVHLVIGHNLDLPLARTGIEGTGGLHLAADEHGLQVRARLNPKVSYVRDLAENMRMGVVDQMSFAFTVAEEDPPDITENEDGSEDELRVIRKMKQLYDVTVTPQGAYSQTSAALRSLGGLARRAAGTNTEVTPLVVGSESVVTQPGGRELQRRAVLQELRRRANRLHPREK